MKPFIPLEEFKERVAKTQALLREKNIDMILCYGNEAEPQFVRYYCDYWPSFETAGVLIPKEGKPLLLIGPESETYAGQMSKIPDIRKLLIFRESSEPEYPEAKLDTFETVIEELMNGKIPSVVGIAGYSLINHVIYQELEKALEAYGEVEIIRADEVVNSLRMKKSDNEIACLREAYRITQEAMKAVVENAKVGMTENQIKGIAMAKIYEEGGEAEAYPFWILTGKGSNEAIGRCRNHVIKQGDMMQVQVAARYEGYASTMGRAIVFGKATPEQRAMIEMDLEAQKRLIKLIKAGVNAGDVCKCRDEYITSCGCSNMLLYGPIHGTGLMEGEAPWIESTSDYKLEAGMTFCFCLYLGDNDNNVGIRIEDGFMVTEDGIEEFSDYKREVIEIL